MLGGCAGSAFTGLRACAVVAGARTTGTAEFDKVLSEGLTSSMDPDSGVASSDAGGAGEGFQRIARDIHLAKDLVIGRLEFVQHGVDALADDLFGLWIGRSLCYKILCPAIERTVFSRAMSIVIDDGVAQDAVEPGDGGLSVAQAGGLFGRTSVSALQDVLRSSA